MTEFDGMQLVRAVEGLTTAVREVGEDIGNALQEIDETLTLIANKRVDDEDEPLPTAGALLEKISGLGAKIVMDSIAAWEKSVFEKEPSMAERVQEIDSVFAKKAPPHE